MGGGSAPDIRVPADAKVISTSGKFIIPGLIDGHVHHDDWVGELLLAHGVTSSSVGQLQRVHGSAFESIDKGFDTGPRIFAAGEFLRGPKPIPGYLQVRPSSRIRSRRARRSASSPGGG